MDYGELLYKAQENDKTSAKHEVRCYKTGFAPPKKLERSVSSASIKKFLAKKEEEERKKMLVAKKRREELLALRSQDKKAQKRVQVMLKRTKSANKSVMDDAVDNNNTADTLCGPNECDDDDFGYVSQEASAYYNQLMSKYNSQPSEPSLFSKGKREVKDLAAAKDRVKAALQKESDEAELPHKRKRKKSESGAEDDEKAEDLKESSKSDSRSSESSSKPKENKVKRINNSAPPPPSFEQLLKLAAVKQHEPIVIENRLAPKEPDRPMTQKEKMEHLREQERKINRERREKGLPPLPSKLPPEKSKHEENRKKSADNRIPKIVKNGEKSSVNHNNKIGGSNDRMKKDGIKELKKLPENHRTQSGDKVLKSSENARKTTSVPVKSSATTPGVKPLVKNDSVSPASESISDIDREIELLRRKRMLLAQQAQASSTPKPTPQRDGPTDVRKKMSETEKIRDKHKTPQSKSVILPSRPSGGPPSRPPVSGSSKTPVPPTRAPPSRPMMKKKPSVKRRIESDEEYDSEMDDFIEDDEEEEDDYSKYISEIFGYDKSRYSNVDDEDECMESNFAQQMKEEFVSTKIGILEDLEDIRKEQEEKKRMLQKKKARKK